jgi:hypothetical protein
MSDIITEHIKEIRSSIPKLPAIGDEYIFSLLCFKYFYNNGRLEYKDFSDCFVDGKLDGGIDLITVQEDDNKEKLVFIQSKLISSIQNKQDMIDVFTKIDQTLVNFQEYKTSQYNPKLRRILKEKKSQVEDKSPIYELALFVGCDPSKDIKDAITNQLETMDGLKPYQTSIVFATQIEEAIKNATEPKTCVAEAKIEICKEDGIITYGENGLLVNVRAHSIRDLYDRYKDHGLFEQNFRYFVRNKRIDDNILDTLKKKREQFWFKNNGIIIGCRDFVPDGSRVVLYDFSIINGCQTATLIGNYKGPNQNIDFVLPCKIVKPIDNTKSEEFISEIAEASNSQKPISDRDLKSNREEQRILQRTLRKDKPEIYLEIKRGSQVLTAAKKKQLQPWQLIRNDLYGQLVLAHNLQCPGTARSAKSDIFSVEKTYNRLFHRPIDKENIVDLLKLNSYYDDFLNKIRLQDEEENVANNGRFAVLAVIGYMIKAQRNLINIQKIGDEEEWEKEISIDNLEGPLFADTLPDDYLVTLDGLFVSIIHEIASLYSTRQNTEKTVSNFLKSDYKYRNVLLKMINTQFFINPFNARKTKEYMKIFR